MKEKVLIAGGSGLVGKRMSQLLLEQGYEVSILSRSQKKLENINVIKWNPSKNQLDKSAFETDHLINLAGAGIADKPWTKSRRKELVESRLVSASFLLEQFQQYGSRLKSYIGASAIGFYGNSGENLQDENSAPDQKSFMTRLCHDWEEAHQKFASIADQVSILRIGIVLSTLGGAYPKMRMTFKLGFGSYFGNGEQYYSWIHIDDLSNMFIHLLQPDQAGSIYNAVSPNPISNKKLTHAIKDTLGIKGLVLPAPSFILKSVMGQLSKVVLNSNRVSSEKIEKTGFTFSFPEASLAIADIEDKSI